MSAIVTYDHTSFTVSDLEAAVGFWRDAMGFEVKDVSPRRQPWLGKVVGVPGATCRIAHLFGHGLHLEFISYDPGFEAQSVFGPANRPGAAHLAFIVNELDGFIENMLAHGATKLGEVAYCDSGHADGCQAIYLRDPSGIIVELVEE